jgi:hypothetical protein
MAFIFESDGKLLAYGMRWAQVEPGRGEKARIADLGRRFDATHKLQINVGGKISHGFLDVGGRLPGKPPKGALVSAAALFAAATPADQNSILVYIFENKKKAAIIAVLGGTVYQDVVINLGANNLEKTDGVLQDDGTFKMDEDAAFAKVRDRVDSIFNETGQEFEPYGNYYFGFPESNPMSPSDLVAANNGSASLIKFSDPRTTIRVAVIAILIAGSLIGYQKYQEREKKRREAAAAAAQVDPMQLYRNNLQTLLPTMKFTGEMADKSIVNVMMARDTVLAGWQLGDFSCDPKGCSEKWDSIGGDNAAFAMANRTGSQQFGTDLKTIVNSYPVSTAAAPMALDEIPAFNQFWSSFSNLAQSMSVAGVSVQIGPEPSMDFSLPPGVVRANVPAGSGIARGEVTVIGPLGLMREVLAKLPANVAITGIKTNPAKELDTISFEIKGYYYVKN